MSCLCDSQLGFKEEAGEVTWQCSRSRTLPTAAPSGGGRPMPHVYQPLSAAAPSLRCRFAQFFISPLISADGVDREAKAVDSE